MNRYKVTFVKNEPISCGLILLGHSAFKGEYNYEYDKGHLVSAIIKAENVAQAIAKSDIIIKEVKDKGSRRHAA